MLLVRCTYIRSGRSCLSLFCTSVCGGVGEGEGGVCHIQHSPNTPTGLRERGNDTSKSTGRSGRQKVATRRNMRREERVTVQGPVKEQQPDGMSHRGEGEGGVLGVRAQDNPLHNFADGPPTHHAPPTSFGEIMDGGTSPPFQKFRVGGARGAFWQPLRAACATMGRQGILASGELLLVCVRGGGGGNSVLWRARCFSGADHYRGQSPPSSATWAGQVVRPRGPLGTGLYYRKEVVCRRGTRCSHCSTCSSICILRCTAMCRKVSAAECIDACGALDAHGMRSACWSMFRGSRSNGAGPRNFILH